jgi:hypothetical protein
VDIPKDGPNGYEKYADEKENKVEIAAMTPIPKKRIINEKAKTHDEILLVI